MLRFSEKIQLVGILTPADITETATGTAFVNMENAHWVSIAVHFGTITGDSVTVTVEVSTGNSTAAGDTAIPFRYRLSGAVASDSWGAITTATASGVIVTAAQDDTVLLIEVNPDDIPALDADASFIRALITPGSSSVSALEVSAMAFLEPRYPKFNPLTSS